MHDQADHLRRLVRACVASRRDLAPGAPHIAISGAQPGVGVTTIACGLARELARLDKQVILVDANLAAPGLAAAFDARPHGTLADVLAGRRGAGEVLIPVADNIRLLPGGDPPGAAPLDAEAVARLDAELTAAARHCDVVLLDAGHGMNPWIDRVWQLAGQVLLATTPVSASVLDAYAALKQADHERASGKLQLVVTRCDEAAEASRIQAAFAATCERFLGQALKPPAVLPTFAAEDAAAHQRAMRLLAADLACEVRILASRVARSQFRSVSRADH